MVVTIATRSMVVVIIVHRSQFFGIPNRGNKLYDGGNKLCVIIVHDMKLFVIYNLDSMQLEEEAFHCLMEYQTNDETFWK
jgi:hypothetical protein